MRSKIGLLMIAIGCVITSAAAQSVSPWFKVGDTTIGDVTNPTPGNSYMTVMVRAASIYQDSNWWTNFVERNRQAVLTINLNGTVAGTNVSTTKTGNPISLERNKSMVDMGFSGVLVDYLPTTFSGMNVDLQINKTAKDGLQNLMTAVAQLSTAQPPVLSISSQAIGIANLGKSVADFLFHSNLLVKLIDTQNAIPSTGMLSPGVYVCLAADSQSDYQQYLDPQLKWNGATLTHNNQPVSQISYFVIEIGYKHRFFANPLDSLSFAATRSWASLYLLAQREIPQINNADEAKKSEDDIQSHLNDARALLDSDPDYISDEKDDIANAVYQKLNDAYHARLVQIGIATLATQTGGQTVPGQPKTGTTTTATTTTTGFATTTATNNPITVTVPNGPRNNLMIMDSQSLKSHSEILGTIRNENANRIEGTTGQPAPH
jgi:hypothetical protein